MIHIASLPILQVFLLSWGFYFPETITPTNVELYAVDTNYEQFVLQVPEVDYSRKYDARTVWQVGLDISSVKDYLETNYGRTLDFYTMSLGSFTFKTLQGHTVNGETYKCAIVPDYFGNPLSYVLNYGAVNIPQGYSDINGFNPFNFTLYTVEHEPEALSTLEVENDQLVVQKHLDMRHIPSARQSISQKHTSGVYKEIIDMIESLRKADISISVEKVAKCLQQAVAIDA